MPTTKEMYQTLNAHKERTEIGAGAIHEHMHARGMFKPENNITVQRNESWFTRIAKMTVAGAFQSVITAYEGIIDTNGLYYPAL